MSGEIEKAATAFRTISEVAEELQVPQHVLRFWETRFSAVRPIKRGGNRRYYRPEDMHLLKVINHLLYTEGYTIRGVQKLLREQGPRNLIAHHVAPAGAAESVNQSGSTATEVGASGATGFFAPTAEQAGEQSRTQFDPGPVSMLMDKANLLASLRQIRADVAKALN